MTSEYDLQQTERWSGTVTYQKRRNKARLKEILKQAKTPDERLKLLIASSDPGWAALYQAKRGR